MASYLNNILKHKIIDEIGELNTFASHFMLNLIEGYGEVKHCCQVQQIYCASLHELT